MCPASVFSSFKEIVPAYKYLNAKVYEYIKWLSCNLILSTVNLQVIWYTFFQYPILNLCWY